MIMISIVVFHVCGLNSTFHSLLSTPLSFNMWEWP